MKVTILNPEVLENLYKNHGEFAATCYDTPMEFAERVGKNCCTANGHMSGSRCEYIKFRLEEISRAASEQCMRHEIGVRYYPIDKYQDDIEEVIDVNPTNIVKNMQSFRYVDKNNFAYVIPLNIIKNLPALLVYENTMTKIEESRQKIKQILIENGIDEHEAVEDANHVLPRATTSTLTIGFTPEALIQFMWKRLCFRAQDEIRFIAKEMKKQIEAINPEFAKELTPHCQHLLWCPERKGCGLYPSKKELQEKLKNIKSDVG